MAVYKRSYSPYSGPSIGEAQRFWTIPGYAWKSILDSRFLLGFLILCMLPWLIMLGIIYVYYNPLVRTLLGMTGEPPFTIEGRQYLILLRVQATLAGILCAWIGPGLIAPDLTNNALPLYLSRPLTRLWYVAGKFSVIFVLMAFITWMPDLLLFVIQASLAGGDWWREHIGIARAVFFGMVLWNATLSFIALAVSAWVKWRVVATGLFAAIPLVAAGFGEMINAVLRTYWGHLLNLPYLFDVIWYGLFDIPIVRRMSRNMVGNFLAADIPLGIAALAIVSVCLICFYMLHKRIRAREVVR